MTIQTVGVIGYLRLHQLSKINNIKWGLLSNANKLPCKNCGNKVKNIIAGFGRLTWERITKGKPDDLTIKRGEICAVCDYRTFLNFAEWGVNFVQDHDLPINHTPGEWDALWCSRCRCCIEAKIRVENEKCPIGKWDEISA